MARQEQDREDLLREATALVERVEFVLPDAAIQIVVGFRRDGCASVYLDQDPAYHFNTSNELRRAYVAEQLYKAERRQLIAMTRQRAADEVQLVRRELTQEKAAQFLDTMHANLQRIAAGLTGGDFTLVGQVPDDIDVIDHTRRWFASLPESISLAASPRAV